MLQKEIFARGLQLINAILSKNSQIAITSTIDSYYLLLNDLPNSYFLAGVKALMKEWKNPHFIPGPGEIRAAVENEMFGGLTKDEFILIARTYSITKQELSDPVINKLLKNIDLVALTTNCEIVVLEENTNIQLN